MFFTRYLLNHYLEFDVWTVEDKTNLDKSELVNFYRFPVPVNEFQPVHSDLYFQFKQMVKLKKSRHKSSSVCTKHRIKTNLCMMKQSTLIDAFGKMNIRESGQKSLNKVCSSFIWDSESDNDEFDNE